MYNSYGATSDSVESAHFADMELGGYNVFSEKSVRLGFIRKVFGIVTIQLIITALIGTAFFVSDNVKQFTIENPWTIWISLIVSIISLISLTCCNIYRSYPGNLICLILFTLSQSLTIGFYTSFSSGEVVLMAIVITTIVVVALILFASQTRIDFTPANGVLYCATLCLILFGLACIIFPSKIILLIYASLGALLFSIWLVVDIQMLLGRNSIYRFSPEDYILASIIIYQDIINIFLNVLDIITLSRS
ncbi:protein lifeguard 1-like [Panonychus citri]|uniref:protein lifeguard 1-like n=1 Tax=Panonychus citri TaxID=50023 RepID=UPI0023076053|nr:protein lifeguard 1-like [Panonychus citri]